MGTPKDAILLRSFSELELDASIAAHQAAMRSGVLSARIMVEMYLERIANFDKRGPSINSIIEINPDALKLADELDAERRRGRIKGPLHGIPIVLKDNIATADRMNTSAGSHLLLGCAVGADATVVTKLRRAGALILGKGNLDEMGQENQTSARGGPVRNPYALDRKITGSSNGTAAAVACNFGALGIGTDTIASVRFPAAECGLVALKPTLGLISRSGILPGMITIDTVGAITRSVSDLATVLGVVAGPDERDLATARPHRPVLFDYLPFLGPGIQNTRIGTLRKDLLGINPEIDAAMETAIEVLRKLGATIIEGTSIDAIPYGGRRLEARRLIQAMDLKAIADYLAELAPESPVRSFEQLRYLLLTANVPTSLRIDSRLRDGDLMKIAALFAEKPELKRLYDLAREEFLKEQQQPILAALEEQHLDAIVFPTETAFGKPLLADDSTTSRSADKPELASFSGFPELTVPAGSSRSGLPIGLSILGKAFSEPILLRLAYTYEQATKFRFPPDLSRTLPRVPKTIPDPPVNDSFSSRIILSGKSGCVAANNFSATVERGEPRHGTGRFIDRTIWYSWTAPESGLVVFDTSRSDPARHVLAVYSGSSLARLTEVACNNYDGGEGRFETVLGLFAEKDNTYQIAIGSNREMVSLGKIVLSWEMRHK